MIAGNSQQASIGGELSVRTGTDVEVTVRVLDPAGTNSNGDNPSVARVDVIVGEVGGILADRWLGKYWTIMSLLNFTIFKRSDSSGRNCFTCLSLHSLVSHL